MEEFSPIHSGAKLFQQYAVDAYVKTEGCRLYYIRNNQAKLRVELYSDLMDHLQNTAIERNIRIGTPVVLPSTFAGSPGQEPCSKTTKMLWQLLQSMANLISFSLTRAIL